MLKESQFARGPLPDAAIFAQSERLESFHEMICVLDAMPSALIILNQDRRIVFANRHLKETLQVDDVQTLYGLLPGELLECPHAIQGSECGTTEACQSCGGNMTVTTCQHGNPSVHECRITQLHTGHALDLRITGTPLEIGGESFILLVMTDISHEKRRQALERIFFHDLMNVATGIIAYARVLSHTPGSPHAAEAADHIRRLVFQLSDEIKAQRELAEAESDELRIFCEPISSLQTLSHAMSIFRDQPLVKNRDLILNPAAQDVLFSCDRTLLNRILGNLVKNALEASGPSERITGTCEVNCDTVEFRIHNPGHIPPSIQLQIFQRSFSTKGRGRGLGTYSIKLLTERYLKGKVWFTSSDTLGTTFFVQLPLAR